MSSAYAYPEALTKGILRVLQDNKIVEKIVRRELADVKGYALEKRVERVLNVAVRENG